MCINKLMEMKKLFVFLAFAVILSVSVQAQFVRYGARLGGGVSYVSDDLLTHSSIFGANVGGYVDYMFTEWKNPWAENIYLEFGLNVVRRGTNFEQVWTNMLSVRQGYYHNWYVQVPVFAGFKWEIPQLPAGNYVNFFLGPTFNVGVFGRLWDRKVTPGMPQISNNYDTYLSSNKDDRRSFKHMRRFDVGFVLGVGYQWHNFTFDIFMDHGFIALMKKDDVLSGVVVNQNNGTDPTGEGTTTTETAEPENRNAYTGTNQAFMISIGYQLPINR